MNRTLTLLQLTLIGCRDAAYTGDQVRVEGELALAYCIREAMNHRQTKQGELLEEGIAEYCRRADELNNEVMNSRADAYRSLVLQVKAEAEATASRRLPVDFSAVVGTIDEGLRLIKQAVEASDLQRCEIEAEHIHNLPALADFERAESSEYYLESQRTQYLTQLRDRYGEDTCRQASKVFENHWKNMLRETET